jgi:peptide/nickel transport system permease protein
MSLVDEIRAQGRGDLMAGQAADLELPRPPRRETFADRFARIVLLRGARRRGLALLCLSVLILIVLSCFVGPQFAHNPSSTAFQPLSAPSLAHPMGTDELGRDQLARMLAGGQTSLIVGALVAAICLTIALAVGGFSGFFGGWVDTGLMRVAEIFQVVPAIILALVAVALLGSSLAIIILLLAATMWPQVARIARSETLKISELGYVESARAVGFGPLHILWSDILPNAFPPILVATTMTAGRAILLESGLAFLGLGDANQPSWGALLSTAQTHIQSAWWLTFYPGIAIFLVVLAINLLGDIWNDNLNPALERVK